MKKYIMSAMAALAMAIPAAAQEPADAVLIHEVSGNVVEYLFSNKPVASFDADDFVMTVGSDVVRYPVANIAKITLRITSDPSGVAEIENLVSIRISSGSLEITGMEPGAEVTVYDLGGLRVAGGVADGSGCFRENLSGLEKGVYMVVTKDRTFKFVK